MLLIGPYGFLIWFLPKGELSVKDTNQLFFWIFNILFSIAAGVAAGFLFSIGNVPNITTVVWIAFGISLAILFLAPVYRFAGRRGCYCAEQYSAPLIIGAALTVVTSIAALAITLNPAFLSVAILVGLGALFFTFTFITFVAYVYCLTR